MKKIYFVLAFFSIASTQSSFAQDSINNQSSLLLTSYYNLKDALVSSTATTSASAIVKLIKTLNGVSKEIINEQNRIALFNDASAISLSNDLKVQREKFASFSSNRLMLDKMVKLSTELVCQQNCLTKKASWLNNNKAIKNPYYGNVMLACGSIKET